MRVIGMYVWFHAALLAVATAWYASAVILYVLPDMFGLYGLVPGWMAGHGNVVGKMVVYGIAPMLTAFACWRCGRALLRAPPLSWPGMAVRWSAVPVASCVLLVLLTTALFPWLSRFELSGPTSPAGFATVIDVRDTLGVGADFYSDVRILDATGRVVAEWNDSTGQSSRSGPQLLHDSMRWVSADTLEFTTRGPRGDRPTVQLTVR